MNGLYHCKNCGAYYNENKTKCPICQAKKSNFQFSPFVIIPLLLVLFIMYLYNSGFFNEKHIAKQTSKEITIPKTTTISTTATHTSTTVDNSLKNLMNVSITNVIEKDITYTKNKNLKIIIEFHNISKIEQEIEMVLQCYLDGYLVDDNNYSGPKATISSGMKYNFEYNVNINENTEWEELIVYYKNQSFYEIIYDKNEKEEYKELASYRK